MPVLPQPVVVFDAYGTLLEIPHSARPFLRLRAILEETGVDTSDYARRAMAHRHGLVSLALSYERMVPQQDLAVLERDLMADLFAVRPFPDARRAIHHVLRRGASVVVASNLAWPYALPVQNILREITEEMGVEPNGGMVRAVFSFDVGHLKPEPAFYQALAASIDDAPGRPFFMVGDRQAEDVDGPLSMGWEAWRLDRSLGKGLLEAPWDRWLPPGSVGIQALKDPHRS